jgi:dTDP-4-amino-4,6-dideoxygalactose transaminase
MIPVSKPFMPPLSEVAVYLARAWSAGVLTNQGELVRELEAALRERLSAPNLLVVANGTLALQLAIRAFDLRGEIITTPFSFAATATSILWEHCTPIFADIDPSTLNLDPAAARAAFTPRTTAILATHVYGNPCDVDAFATLRADTGCALLYDAAHAFDVKIRGESILSFGDASALSFHATKVFHSAEGGAIVLRDSERRRRVERLRNFGQSTPGTFDELGMNAKMSEMNAAVGLTVLAHLETIIARRCAITETYDAALGSDSPSLQRPTWHPDATRNHAYYPVVLESEGRTLRVVNALEGSGYQARRYFYPALSKLPYLPTQDCPVAEDIARRVLCLPLHADMAPSHARAIADLVVRTS